MGKGKRFNTSDPTANAAIGRVTKAEKAKVTKRRRRIVEEFPDVFDDLSPVDRQIVALRAGRIAGSAWALTREHLDQARHEHDREIGGVA